MKNKSKLLLLSLVSALGISTAVVVANKVNVASKDKMATLSSPTAFNLNETNLTVDGNGEVKTSFDSKETGISVGATVGGVGISVEETLIKFDSANYGYVTNDDPIRGISEFNLTLLEPTGYTSDYEWITFISSQPLNIDDLDSCEYSDVKVIGDNNVANYEGEGVVQYSIKATDYPEILDARYIMTVFFSNSSASRPFYLVDGSYVTPCDSEPTVYEKESPTNWREDELDVLEEVAGFIPPFLGTRSYIFENNMGMGVATYSYGFSMNFLYTFAGVYAPGWDMTYEESYAEGTRVTYAFQRKDGDNVYSQILMANMVPNHGVYSYQIMYTSMYDYIEAATTWPYDFVATIPNADCVIPFDYFDGKDISYQTVSEGSDYAIMLNIADTTITEEEIASKITTYVNASLAAGFVLSSSSISHSQLINFEKGINLEIYHNSSERSVNITIGSGTPTTSLPVDYVESILGISFPSLDLENDRYVAHSYRYDYSHTAVEAISDSLSIKQIKEYVAHCETLGFVVISESSSTNYINVELSNNNPFNPKRFVIRNQEGLTTFVWFNWFDSYSLNVTEYDSFADALDAISGMISENPSYPALNEDTMFTDPGASGIMVATPTSANSYGYVNLYLRDVSLDYFQDYLYNHTYDYVGVYNSYSIGSLIEETQARLNVRVEEFEEGIIIGFKEDRERLPYCGTAAYANSIINNFFNAASGDSNYGGYNFNEDKPSFSISGVHFLNSRNAFGSNWFTLQIDAYGSKDELEVIKASFISSLSGTDMVFDYFNGCYLDESKHLMMQIVDDKYDPYKVSFIIKYDESIAPGKTFASLACSSVISSSFAPIEDSRKLFNESPVVDELGFDSYTIRAGSSFDIDGYVDLLKDNGFVFADGFNAKKKVGNLYYCFEYYVGSIYPIDQKIYIMSFNVERDDNVHINPSDIPTTTYIGVSDIKNNISADILAVLGNEAILVSEEENSVSMFLPSLDDTSDLFKGLQNANTTLIDGNYYSVGIEGATLLFTGHLLNGLVLLEITAISTPYSLIDDIVSTEVHGLFITHPLNLPLPSGETMGRLVYEDSNAYTLELINFDAESYMNELASYGFDFRLVNGIYYGRNDSYSISLVAGEVSYLYVNSYDYYSRGENSSLRFKDLDAIFGTDLFENIFGEGFTIEHAGHFQRDGSNYFYLYSVPSNTITSFKNYLLENFEDVTTTDYGAYKVWQISENESISIYVYDNQISFFYSIND